MTAQIAATPDAESGSALISPQRRNFVFLAIMLGMLMAALEKRPDIATILNASFERMLARYREVQGTSPELAPRPKPRRNRDFRRRKQ